MTDDQDARTASISAALGGLRLRGSLLLRAEFTEDWAYESPPYDDLAAALQPGTRRLVLFHIVASGACWVATLDGEHEATAGDVIVVPYADRHRVRGARPAPPIRLDTLLPTPPWERLPSIRHGGGGEPTEIVCGYLESDDPLFDPTLRALPALFVARPDDEATQRWVEANVDYALQMSGDGGVPAPVGTRLAELLLVEVLRQYLSGAPPMDHGWLAGLHDPVVARAMALIHAMPARKWTGTDLANEVSVSRSLLNQRFRDVLGRSPMRYLADWRMHVAAELLATTNLGIVAVAHRVGYSAEEAFSRAFKRAYGESPGTWRDRQALSATSA